MAHSFLIFDFGTNEEAAQQARHTIERWKQGYRLDKKVLLKLDRGASTETGANDKGSDSKKEKAAAEKILMIVRLDFSDHEKLSHQRWVERIPGEAGFKDAHPKVIRQGDADFAATAERFENLD